MDQNHRALKELSNNNSMENNLLTNSVKSPTVSNNTASEINVEKLSAENLENQEILVSSKENNPKSLCELAAEKTTVIGISNPNNITSTPKAAISTKNPAFNFANESVDENNKPINKKLSLGETPTKSDSLSFLASGLGQLQIEDLVPTENSTYLQSQTITSDDEQFLECESFVSANTTRVLETEEPAEDKTLEEKPAEVLNLTATVEPQSNDGNGNLNKTVDVENVKVEAIPDEFSVPDMNGPLETEESEKTLDAEEHKTLEENPAEVLNITATVEPQSNDGNLNKTVDIEKVEDEFLIPDMNRVVETVESEKTLDAEDNTLEANSVEALNVTATIEPQTNYGSLNETVDMENVEIKVEEIPDEFPAPDMNRTMDVVKISDTFIEEKMDATFNAEAVENDDLKNVTTTLESAPTDITFDQHELSDDKNESDDKIMSMTLECQLLEEDKPVELAEPTRVEVQAEVAEEMMEVDDDAFESEAATVKIENSHDSEFDNNSCAKVNRILSEGDAFNGFKKPDIPTTKTRRSDPFAGATQFNSQFENEEFKSSAGFNFAAADFDFLDQFGAPTNAINDIRNSVLLNFDPLLKKPVVNEDNNNNIKNQLKAKKLSITKEEFESNNDFELDFGVENKDPTSITENSIDIKQELSTESIDSNNLKLDASNELEEHDSQYQLDHVKMNVDAMKDFIVDSRESTKLECQDIKSNQEQEYKMADLENKIKNEVLKTEEIENKLKEAEMREEALLKRITEKDKTIAKMSSVVEAYEKAISELIAEKEQLQQNYEKQCAELKHDSEINAQHLASLEATFSDIHAKYERAKQVALELKEREDFLLQERKTNAENLKMMESRYDKMKSHAMAQLEIANNTLAEITRNHNAEVTKLKAILRKEEVSKASMMEQLQQKTKENEELVKICDELINGGQTS